MLFLYREQDIRFFGLCHDPGSDDAFPNLGKSNFDSGIDIGPCLVFYSSSSVSYHEKKARVVKIPAYSSSATRRDRRENTAQPAKNTAIDTATT
jgi:hypothetical protein